jgi:NTE family protein
LNAFWDQMEQAVAGTELLDWFGLGGLAANIATLARGIPNFFTPNPLAWRGTGAALGVESASYYSTAPLRQTLSELVDFEYLCQCHTRMTVGAVNVCTGRMRYFDTRNEPLCADHVLASGALPPAFGAIRIDGQPYWDGGVYSNTPIEAVLDDNPRRDSLIFAVNVWHQTAPEPESIWEVLSRHKDIQYASRADNHIARQKQIHRLRHVIRELYKEMPPAVQSDPRIKDLASWGCVTTIHVAHLVAPRLDGEDHTKDIDFTPIGVQTRRRAGYGDTMRMIERAPWQQPADPIEGMIEHM